MSKNSRNSRDEDSSNEEHSAVPKMAILAGSTLLLLLGAGIFLSLTQRWSVLRFDAPGWFWVFASLATGLASGAVLIPILEYLRRVQYIDLRVAITGQPQAGKTMFSVGLFNALLAQRGHRLQFTAEAQTIISVYQAISNISKNVWPESTPLDVVNRYEGRLRYGASRNGIDLELGDSAGEYWASINENVDASYLKYVLSANAIAHVIPADKIVGSSGSSNHFTLAQEKNDLLLAARLARGVRKRPHLLIILSKLDLVLDDPDSLQNVCLKIWTPQSQSLPTYLEAILGRGGADDVLQFIEGLRSEFESVAVTFSSVTGEMVGSIPREELSQWLFHVSRR